MVDLASCIALLAIGPPVASIEGKRSVEDATTSVAVWRRDEAFRRDDQDASVPPTAPLQARDTLPAVPAVASLALLPPVVPSSAVEWQQLVIMYRQRAVETKVVAVAYDRWSEQPGNPNAAADAYAAREFECLSAEYMRRLRALEPVAMTV